MKRILTLFTTFSSLIAIAQYPVSNINISLPSKPLANTSAWGTSSFIITAQAKLIQGQIPGNLIESRILVTIKMGGSKVCGSYTQQTAPMSLFNTASKTWAGGVAAGLLGNTCILKAGSYELCVQFFSSYAPVIPLSAEVCKSFVIADESKPNYILPVNILPAAGKEFTQSDVLQPIQFRWTPLLPLPPQTDPVYKIRVYEIGIGQNSAEAARMNSPVFEKEVNNTQAIWAMPAGLAKSNDMKSFVWNVQTTRKGDGKPYGEHNGVGEGSLFSVKPGSGNPHLRSSTTAPSCNNISTTAFHAGDIIHLSDDFELTLTEDPTGTNDLLSGKGTVDVKWVSLLNVQFNKIKINTDNKLCSGTVYTVSEPTQTPYPTQWAVNVLNNLSIGAWNATRIKSICEDIRANKLIKPLIPASTIAMISPHGLNMPLGYIKNNDENTAINFTEMIFHSNYAEFEVVASLNTTGVFKNSGNTMNGTDALALQGRGIHFTNSGLHGVSGTISLTEPVTFTYANMQTEALKLTFNTEATGHIGNSVVFSDDQSETEFWKYNIDVNVQLPKEWLVPVDPAKTNVDMNFQLGITTWDEFVLQGSLPECIIPNSNGLGIKIGNIVYDHSAIENSNSMVFPEQYQGNRSVMFSGFYLKDFRLTLPDQLRSYADTGKKIEVISQNLIIDKDGITGKIFANNVLTYPTANVGNLGASIDTVSVNLSNSVLMEAKMLGRITLPMSSSDDIANSIHYLVLFLPSAASIDNTSSLTFTLKPDRDIKSKFFGDGKIQVDQTSSLFLVLKKSSTGREINLNVDLNGKLYYPTGNILDPNSTIPLDLDLSCNFEHLGMTYAKHPTETFTFNVGHWSFASPPKKLCGFAFTITDVKPKIDPIIQTSEAEYLFKGGVEFIAKINIGTDKVAISGDVKILLEGAVISSKYGTTNINDIASIKQDYGFLTHMKPKFLGVKIEDVHVDVKVAAAEIKGNVHFYKNDAVYGNAFMGDLTVKFTTLNLGIQSGAVFGNTKYRPNNVGPGFKYWMVQAQANLPPPGIVFMTGLAFRGFGAGVYSRMKMTPPTVFNPTQAASSTFGGAVFTPDATVSVGFKAKAIIATTPKEETFNGSVALAAEFNTSGGMNFIEIEGLFNCGAAIGKEAEAFANGQIIVHYDFPHKIFDMNSKLIIHKDPIETTGDGIQTKLYIDGTNNKWFFKSGTPLHPNGINVFGMAIHSYLEFGNDIEIPTGFMKETVDGFARVGYTLAPFSNNLSSEYQSAKGFAFGIGLNYLNSDSWNIASWRSYYVNANYNIDAGGEIDASFLQYTGCEGLGKGWRAKASMAMYASASIGYSYNLPGTSNSGFLFKINGCMSVSAEFPKPTFFAGQFDGDMTIVGDYKAKFHKSFQMGEQCVGATLEIDPSINQNVYTQQNVGDSLSYSLIKNIVTPGGTTNVSRTTGFSVLLNYPYNESFDIQEQQSTGQIKVRTFRAFYTAFLTQDSVATSYSMVQNLNTNVNGLTSNDPSSNTTPTLQANTVNQQLNNNGNIQPAVRNGTGMPTTTQSNSTRIPPPLFISTALDLKDAPYDDLGAKLFRIKALVDGGILHRPENALKPNTSYKFKIMGVLQEKIGNNWVPVNHKNSTIQIKQTKTFFFKTNSDLIDNLQNANTNGNFSNTPSNIQNGNTPALSH